MYKRGELVKRRKAWILSIAVSIILLLVIFIIWNNNMGNKSNQVRETVKFLNTIIDIQAIDVDKRPEPNEIDEVKSSSNSNSKVAYTMIWNKCGVDLDENYHVVGFLDNDIQKSDNEIISQDECENYAAQYLGKLINDRYEIKSFANNNEDKQPFYTLTYIKYHNSYPNYDNEIILKINKKTGKLVSYSAYSDDDIKYTSKILVTEKKAKTTVEEYFNKLNQKVETINYNNEKGYFNNGDNESTLCYVFKCRVKINRNVYKNYEVIVNTKNGDVINSIEI